MPSIRITQFAGLLPEVNPKALRNDHAQIAHNCLLWDGWLRPMPRWQQVQTYASQPTSLIPYNTGTNFGFFTDTKLVSAIFQAGEPFASPYPFGIYNNQIQKNVGGENIVLAGVPIPNVSGLLQTISPRNQSVYPIARTYAITLTSNNVEGPPLVFPQIGANGTLFEGDYVSLSFVLDAVQINAYNITALKLYRTVPAFDTSEQLGNPAETAFHLVDEFNYAPGLLPAFFSYVDQFDSSQIPGDIIITDQFMPPAVQPQFLGQTESGWAVAVQYTNSLTVGPANIQISERYVWDAWPPQNTVYLQENVQAATIFYEDIFIGTDSRPYHIHVDMSQGDALNISMKPFPDYYSCIPGTMVSTNFGAMYATPDGLVALTASGDNIASKRVANPGDSLFVPITQTTVPMAGIGAAFWWNGNYFGIYSGQSFAYIFNQPNPSNNEFPLGQFVTIDTPAGVFGANVVTGYGAFALWGNVLYNFPLPGYGYEMLTERQLAPYVWKSKRYVLPGLTTFSAAKVVNDQSGNLIFQLYGDGNLILARGVGDSNPFRIPHQHKCIEWEIELFGTSVVQEIHVATSMRDLTEDQNG